MTRELLKQALNALNSTNLDLHADAVEAIRAHLAQPQSEPTWHDAPTCAGLWVCRQAITDNVQAYEVTDQMALNRNLKLKGQWYGPIPEDKP